MPSKNPNRPLAKLAKADSKSPWYFLSLLLITHIFIDGSASIVAPLLKRLGVHHQASDLAMGAVAACLFASISFSQPLFGYIYDRFRAYWIMPIPVLIVASSLAFVGVVDSFALLVALVIIGGLAVGAFHPAATAMAGSLDEKRRPLMIAIFVCAGAIGVGGGPWVISRLVNAQGLGATAWLFAAMVPVLIIAMLAFLTYRKLPHSKLPTPKRPLNLRSSFFSRTVVLLFGVATSRSFALVVCGSGMSFLMNEKIADSSLALLRTGTATLVFGLSLGAGGLLSGLFVHPKSEKPGILISLLIAAPLLIFFPILSGAWLLLALALGGGLLNSTVPLVTAIGQRLLPHSSALASGVFMGLAWGTSGVIAPIAVTWLGTRTSYALAMPILISAGLLLSLLCTLALPRIIRPADDSHNADDSRLVPDESSV